eukprot:4239055-Pleurochrysis_carterae.AAC.1
MIRDFGTLGFSPTDPVLRHGLFSCPRISGHGGGGEGTTRISAPFRLAVTRAQSQERSPTRA